MRERLERLVVLAAGVAGLAAFLLAVLSFVLVAARRPEQFLSWRPGDPLEKLAPVVLAALVLGVVVALAGWFAARTVTARVTSATADLLGLARRFGDGEARLTGVHTGIDEFDTVSEVITRRSLDMTRSLAAERQFASDASHQLRTPLTALLMRLEEIAETDDAAAVKEEAVIAIDQVERLTRVVDDLLGRTRITDGPVPAVSLDSVIAALQREYQPAFAQARRSVRVRGERGLFVHATPIALSQILSTLLENALVHGRGTVDVDARRSGPSVVVEVSDEGEGIPAAMAPHIFERSVSGGTGGSSGLGLALARDLAEANGGRLDLLRASPVRFALFLSEARQR